MDDLTIATYRSLKHPLISVAVPFGFVWLVASLLRRAVPGLGAIPGIYPVLLLIAALSETAVGNYLVSRKSAGVLPRLRELVVVLLFSFLFVKLVNGDVFRGDWGLGRFDIVLPIIFAGIEWVLCILIHSALRERELLLSLVAGKERNELKECFRDMGAEASNSLAGLTRVRQIIVVFQVLAFVALFVVSLARPAALSAGVVVLAILHFVAGIVSFFTVNGYMEQQAVMGEGFALTREISGRRTTFAVALCFVACAGLVPLVGRDAPLPSSYLQSFIEWLQRIATLPEQKGPVRYEAPATSRPDATGDEQSRALSGLEGVSHGNEALQRFLRILILVLVVGLPGAAVLILLVAPIFRRREEKLHPLRALRGWLARTARALGQGARNFASALRRSRRAGARRASLREILFGRGQAEQGRETDGRVGFFQRLAQSREIKAFVKVIKWGERHGVRWSRCLGPREYAVALGSSVPAVSSELETVADILEELLFSGRGIAAERSERYFEAARLVLRQR